MADAEDLDLEDLDFPDGGRTVEAPENPVEATKAIPATDTERLSPTPADDHASIAGGAPSPELATNPGYQNWIAEEETLASCFQNRPRAFELAQAALDLAKQGLWFYTRDHHPELFRRLSPYAPSLIRAGRGELRAAIKRWELAPGLRWHLDDLADLRNFVAHLDTRPTLAGYDEYVRCAEALLAELGDEERLGRLQEARDTLRQEAVDTLADIEARELLAELEGGHNNYDEFWSPNQVDLFKRVLDLPPAMRNDRRFVHPLVCRVAESWGDVHYRGGLGGGMYDRFEYGFLEPE
jgi:hypothetical protein